MGFTGTDSGTDGADDGLPGRNGHGSLRHGGVRCNCSPGYEAGAWDPLARKALRRTFRSRRAALDWRNETMRGLREGRLRAGDGTTVQTAANALLEGMESGAVRTKRGTLYKPSVVRSYRASLTLHVLPALGSKRLHDLERRDVQQLADELAAKHDPSTVRNALMPLRVIYRRALQDGVLAVSPLEHLRLPAVEGRRERIATPAEAAALLAALDPDTRAIYATAFYAGLRLGELRALRWSEVDLADGHIEVVRAMDGQGGLIAPKSRAGRRTVPLVPQLRELLTERRAITWTEGYVLGRTSSNPFTPSAVNRRASAAWAAANERIENTADKLRPIGLHECRHTFASLLIAAGANAKAIATAMGHSSVQITLDVYGKLMPGDEDQTAALLGAYLERTDTQARIEQVTS